MYALVLILHSWLRWLAIVSGVGATFAALRSSDTSTERPAEWWGLLFMTTLDVQLLLGLLLYLVVSPNMQMIREHFGEAMRIGQLRFWAVEHIGAMIVAVALAHVGRAISRRAPTPAARRRRQLVCFGLATILMLVAIPWPGLPYGRPLLRW